MEKTLTPTSSSVKPSFDPLPNLIEFWLTNHSSFEGFSEWCNYHHIQALIFLQLKESNNLQAKEHQQLKNAYYLTIRNNALKENEFFEITSLFQKEGIPIIPLKGISFLLGLYKDLPIRPMADLDILIPKEKIYQAKQLLIHHGYEPNFSSEKEKYLLNHQMHFEFINKNKGPFHGNSLEVHWAIDYDRKNNYLETLWKNATKIELNNGIYSILTPEDSIFSIALHQRRFGRLFQLKYVIDLYKLFSKYSIDTEYLLKQAHKNQMQTSLWALLFQTTAFFDNKERDILLKKLRVSKFKKFVLSKLITSTTNQTPKDIRSLFFKAHLFLFDSFQEPLFYMLFIPFEQFCKFFNLPPKKPFTSFLYQIRHLYAAFKVFFRK